MSTPMRIISGGRRGNSIGLVPGDAETHGGIDHADHAVGLREIPPQFAGARVDMLREQPVAVAGERESKRLNSSYRHNSDGGFLLEKKKKNLAHHGRRPLHNRY